MKRVLAFYRLPVLVTYSWTSVIKQETEECSFKLWDYIYYQGTYTPPAGNEKGAGLLPLTGIKYIFTSSIYNMQTKCPR